MGFTHHYDLIKGSEDAKDEPQPTHIPTTGTSWWKFLLCNLLAASLGAGVTFLIARSYFETQHSTSASPSASDGAPLSFDSSSATPFSIFPTATPTPSAPLVLPTPAIDEVDDDDDDDDTPGPNMPLGLILDCGGNPEQARAKGCVYDVMMQDWVPVPCYDEVLTERYLAQGNWTWYADGEAKTILSDEDMRKGEHGVAWMSNSYHKAHCVFSWIKIVRALRNNRGISQELMSYDHVLHCSNGALKLGSDDESLGVIAPTNYAKCALYETWRRDPIPDQHDASQR